MAARSLQLIAVAFLDSFARMSDTIQRNGAYILRCRVGVFTIRADRNVRLPVGRSNTLVNRPPLSSNTKNGSLLSRIVLLPQCDLTRNRPTRLV